MNLDLTDESPVLIYACECVPACVCVLVCALAHVYVCM